ncbi:outer membrane protein [Phyllobacterium leguminum]|uniref:Outer membrane immunogenic protein n=1 Tax=Phyllobacterium leguminum TaxID=314237 RepID=A0A318T3W1_9HYPH|nr:outer membrane protein [Phyllobacterium leguminum]PYE89362.1 outer membrane immunogenic protein [Phyllobacterium leguminum]
MKIMYFIVASAIALCAATAVKAADAIQQQEPAPPEAAAPAFSWTGVYLGAQAGYGWAHSKGEFEDGGNIYSHKLRPSGWLGGLYGGYNFDAGNGFILGAEADMAYAGIKKDESFSSVSVPAVGFTHEARMRWEGAVRGRAGYAVDRFLPYLAGGFAFGKVEHDIARPGMVSYEKKQTRTGWTAGAGVDYAATDNLLLRVEYRYVDLGKESFDFLDSGFETKFKSHEIRFGVAYKF